MTINSKNKGNAFERKVAKLLSQRFSDKTGIENSFRRNIDSGSFFGGMNRTRAQTHSLDKATFGDIVCPSGFKFSVECKHYKEPPSFATIARGSNATLDQWIEQATDDASRCNSAPLIVMKFNNIAELVMLEASVWGSAPAIHYRDFVIVDLDRLLARGDEFFFAE